MKIERCKDEDFGQRRFAAKYSLVFDKIKEIKIGEVIKVTLDENNPNFYATLMQHFRKGKFREYKCSVRRKDREGKIFLIMKIKRD